MELERSAGGLLRVTIDFPWSPGDPADRLITVEDCERVTRQLQYVLEVEGVDYARLRSRRPALIVRCGMRWISSALGAAGGCGAEGPIGQAAASQVHANRKKFRGTLHKAEGEQWQIVWRDEPAPAKPGRRGGRQRPPRPSRP